jgi:hypothetical protein
MAVSRGQSNEEEAKKLIDIHCHAMYSHAMQSEKGISK